MLSINDVTRPQNVSDRVWEDFVSVFINGERPSDVADATNRKPSSISANVKRVRLELGLKPEDGAQKQTGARNGNGESSETTTRQPVGITNEDAYKIADSMLPPFGRMFVHERERMAQNAPTNAEVEKCEESLRKAQDALAEAIVRYEARVAQYNAEKAAFEEAASAAGFDYDAFDEAVALAKAEAEQGERDVPVDSPALDPEQDEDEDAETPVEDAETAE